MSRTIEEEKVSQLYHSLESDAESIVPPAKVDSFILKAAAVKVEKHRKKNKFFIPLSAAASIVIIVTLALQTSVIRNKTVTEYNELTVTKQPMYMLQRAKPVSADEMMQHVNDLHNEGDFEQARLLFKKLKTRYPEYKFSADLSDKLK